MIASGDFALLFTALKGFRNGVVYGTRVRAPHALVLNLVWSKAPYRTIPGKVLQVTKTHALGLGWSAVVFALTRGILQRLQGTRQIWHDALAGFLIGFLFWGNPSNGVHIQMMMYMIARVICALYHLLSARMRLNIPTKAYRFFSGALWSCTILFLLYEPQMLQSSMLQSLRYIFQDSGRFNNWYDLLVVNSADTL